MKNPDNEKNDAKKDLAQTLYDAAMDDKENAGKGLHMSKRPYLWEENHITIESDNPTERFVPTPTIHTGTEGPAWKKAVKIFWSPRGRRRLPWLIARVCLNPAFQLFDPFGQIMDVFRVEIVFPFQHFGKVK